MQVVVHWFANVTPCAKRDSASCMAPHTASCEHGLFKMIKMFVSGGCMVDVARGI